MGRCKTRPRWPDTVKRYIDTLKCIFNWALKQELVDKAPSLRGLVYGKRDEKPPFMTRTEIERIINRGGLSKAEIAKLWDAMYLTIPEVHEVLELVKTQARYPFIYTKYGNVVIADQHSSSQLHESDNRHRSKRWLGQSFLSVHVLFLSSLASGNRFSVSVRCI